MFLCHRANTPAYVSEDMYSTDDAYTKMSTAGMQFLRYPGGSGANKVHIIEPLGPPLFLTGVPTQPVQLMDQTSRSPSLHTTAYLGWRLRFLSVLLTILMDDR